MRTVIICINARYIEPSFVVPLFSRGVLSVSLHLNRMTQGGIMKKQPRQAVVVGADRLGKIPQLLKQHNIRVSRHISGRDPAHQKKGLQLPSGTEVLILLTDFLGHNVMKSKLLCQDRKSTRLNSSHVAISYAVFCLKKKTMNKCINRIST